LIQEIRDGTPLGRILGNGADCTGNVFGVERIPVVKKQAISAYDPRAIKGTGVTYATSPQGADHTSGLTIRADIDHLDPEGQVDVSRTAQFKSAGYDSLGVCAFAGFGFSLAPELISKLLNYRYGWEVPENIFLELGKECIDLEIKFNKLAGFTNKDDRIPEWMTLEKLPPHNTVFDVEESDLDNLFK
jgi:aldehyde:ferredoxin oxidoreductase